MKKTRSFAFILAALLLLLCSCSVSQFNFDDYDIAVFEDYDSLVAFDNSKLKLTDFPVKRIIVCTKGDEIFGIMTGNFPKYFTKNALKKVDTGMDINIVSSNLIEFSTPQTEKPSSILDDITKAQATGYEIFFNSRDFSVLPMEEFELPDFLLGLIDLVTVCGSDNKVDISLDIMDKSTAKVMYILMKAAMVVDAEDRGEALDTEKLASMIELDENSIHLYDFDFDFDSLKDSFGSLF